MCIFELYNEVILKFKKKLKNHFLLNSSNKKNMFK